MIKPNTMKQLLCILTGSLSFITSQGQILNGSFENGSNSDLTNWEWTCLAQSYNNAPTGGGNWCIKVWGGNTQGCFPGYAYQKIPSITNGLTFILSGWAFAQTAPPIGLYFGKINNGVVTLQSGDTTSSTSWTQLSIQSSFSLSSGDTALVVLYGGLAGGPVQGYGYFDLINLQQVTGINSLEQKQSVKIFPNPFNNQTILQTDNLLHNATLTVDNIFGQTVKQIKNISGQTVVLSRDNLASGLYFIRLTQDSKVITADKLVITD
jgi:hypothetical protein